VLPFVMPIMQAARALAPTLIGMLTRCATGHAGVVKTPACPTVVSPPDMARRASGRSRKWTMASEHYSAVRKERRLLGSHCGAVTAKKNALLHSCRR